MHIVDRSESHLTLYHRPLVVWFFSFVALFVGIFIPLSERDTTVTCQRVSPSSVPCTVTARALLDVFPPTTTAFGELQGARIEQVRPSRKKQPRHVVSLRTTSGEVTVESYSPDDAAEAGKHASSIERFLTAGGDQALVEVDNRASRNAPTGVLAVTGALLALTFLGRPVTVDLNKHRGTLLITRHGVFGARDEEHPLSAVTRVLVDSTSNGRKSTSSRIEFCLSNGEVLAPTGYDSLGLDDKAGTANTIRDFLGLGPRPADASASEVG